MQPFWSFRDETAVIDRTAMKREIIVVPRSQHQGAFHQLHINHVGIGR